MGRDRFHSDLTRADLKKRLVRINRFFSIFSLIVIGGLVGFLILSADWMVFQLVLMAMATVGVVYLLISQKKNNGKMIKEYRPKNNIEVTKELIIIPKGFNIPNGKVYTIEISNIERVDLDATRYIEGEKKKSSWFRRNIWGGYVPQGALWNGNWPKEYHLLVHLKESIHLGVPWINPRGLKTEIIKQDTDKVLLSIRPGEKDRFIRVIEERMNEIGTTDDKPEKKKMKKVKNEVLLEINTTPIPGDVLKKNNPTMLKFFIFTFILVFLVWSIMLVAIGSDLLETLVISFLIFLFMALLLFILLALVYLITYLENRKRLKKIRELNKVVLKERFIEVHSLEMKCRERFQNSIPLKYIVSLEREDIQKEYKERINWTFGKFVKTVYQMDERYLCHTDSSANSLVKLNLNKAVKVRWDPLGRQKNVFITGPLSVKEVVISIPISRQDEFIEKLLELNPDVKVFD